ncbi:hypothetical protein AAC387_Pa09g0011 [Persea americana]
MPTFPAVALERLLEPASPTKPEKLKQVKSSQKHIYISPALYTTPNPTPVPNSSPSSASPSPYVVNWKRRGGSENPPPPPDLQLHGFHVNTNNSKEDEDEDEDEEEGEVKQTGQGQGHDEEEEEEAPDYLGIVPILDEEEEGLEVVQGKPSSSAKEREEEGKEGVLDEFADPCDSMSVASSCGSNGASSKHRLLSIQTEFYDAPDDFLSDGSTSLRSYSFRSNVEAELHAARLNLSEEIEKRKKAEEALVLMRNQWQRIVCHLSQAALSFPMTSETGETPLEIESVEQSCQEYIFLKFVSEAVVRDQARAETEADAKAIIDAKNQEIARLQDKLQYCETVNREMSQRNQEIMEMSRKQRQSCLRRKKWIWSCIGLSVALGASVLACSYLPDPGGQPVTSYDGSNTS